MKNRKGKDKKSFQMETKRMAQEKEKWQLVYDTKRRLKLKTEMAKWKRINGKQSNRERKKGSY